MAWFFTLVLYSFVLLEVEGSHRKRHRCHSRGGTASVGGIKIHHCWSGWSSTSSGGSSCSGVSQSLTSEKDELHPYATWATWGEGPLGSRYSDASGRYKCFSPPVARSYTGGYGRWVQPTWLNQVGCSANISLHVLRSTSSGGFGLGLGNGLLLGYSTWRFSSGGYGGFGYGHNYGQYARVGGYSTERWAIGQ